VLLLDGLLHVRGGLDRRDHAIFSTVRLDVRVGDVDVWEDVVLVPALLLLLLEIPLRFLRDPELVQLLSVLQPLVLPSPTQYVLDVGGLDEMLEPPH